MKFLFCSAGIPFDTCLNRITPRKRMIIVLKSMLLASFQNEIESSSAAANERESGMNYLSLKSLVKKVLRSARLIRSALIFTHIINLP